MFTYCLSNCNREIPNSRGHNDCCPPEHRMHNPMKRDVHYGEYSDLSRWNPKFAHAGPHLLMMASLDSNIDLSKFMTENNSDANELYCEKTCSNIGWCLNEIEEFNAFVDERLGSKFNPNRTVQMTNDEVVNFLDKCEWETEKLPGSDSLFWYIARSGMFSYINQIINLLDLNRPPELRIRIIQYLLSCLEKFIVLMEIVRTIVREYEINEAVFNLGYFERDISQSKIENYHRVSHLTHRIWKQSNFLRENMASLPHNNNNNSNNNNNNMTDQTYINVSMGCNILGEQCKQMISLLPFLEQMRSWNETFGVGMFLVFRYYLATYNLNFILYLRLLFTWCCHVWIYNRF